jgi:hypothetical protein
MTSGDIVKVLIVQPRLDLMFKKGLSRGGGVHNDLRDNWRKFTEKLMRMYAAGFDDSETTYVTRVIEVPSYQITPELVDAYEADVALIPHKEWVRFSANTECLFYMQTVFPHLFTVDTHGWGGGSEYSSYPMEQYETHAAYDKYQQRKANNTSKIPQPVYQNIKLPKDYIFVPLQLPHDETIKYHSAITVEEFVESLCVWAKNNPTENIVFKGHPANIASMEPLVNIMKSHALHNVTYVTNVSIHQLFEKAKAVFVINSGTAIEAMLYNLPILRFGRADYNAYVPLAKLDSIDENYNDLMRTSPETRLLAYKNFYEYFTTFPLTIDVNDGSLN